MNGSSARALRAAARLACALAFGLPLAASAQENSQACRDTRLAGLYVFSASGYQIVNGVALPKAIVETIAFNGDGMVTTPWVTVMVNGNLLARGPGSPGKYEFNADCRGVLTFDSGTSFDFTADLVGGTLTMIQLNPGSVFQGTARRLMR